MAASDGTAPTRQTLKSHRWRWLWAGIPLIFLSMSVLFWSSESFWERTEYTAEAIVFVGCLGEFVTEYEHILSGDNNKPRRHQLGRLFAIVLMAGLAVELAALVRTNELFSGTIALLNKEAGNARKESGAAIERASKADERTSANEKEAAILRKQAEDERLARLKLQERVSWRAISPSDITNAGTRLRAYHGVQISISTVANNEEAIAFSDDISDLVNVARWSMPRPVTPFTFTGRQVVGLNIFATPDEATQTAARALSRELDRIGLFAPVTDTESPGGATGPVAITGTGMYIRVGLRPRIVPLINKSPSAK